MRAVPVVVSFVVAALVATAAPAAAEHGGDHQAPPPLERQLHRACPVDAVPAAPFTDVRNQEWPPGNVAPPERYRTIFGLEIECLYWYGITSGVTETKFRNRRWLTRAQMATFITNLIDDSAEHGTTQALPPSDGDDLFTDTSDSVHRENINRLAQAGIVQGGPGGRGADEYGPELTLRRDQLATFLQGAQAFMTGQQVASSNDFFADDDDSVHESNINAMVELMVLAGRGRGLGGHEGFVYEPRAQVTRAHMATMLARLLDFNVFTGRVLTRTQRDREPSNESFAFRAVPDTTEVSASELSDEGRTEFAVTQLGEQEISVGLFHCDDVFDERGLTGFRDDDDDGLADFDADREGAVIESVNGEQRLVDRDRYAGDVQPQDGTVTFTVDSTTTDCVVAAAFVDGNDNDALDLDAENLPTEDFGISGRLLFQPEDAGDGTLDVTVLFTDQPGSFFIGENDAGDQRTYRFHTTDAFAGPLPPHRHAPESDDSPVSYGWFHVLISRGDQVSGDYVADGVSSFLVTDAAPAPLIEVTAEITDITARVTWTPSPTETVTGYRILRADCPEDPKDARSELIGEVGLDYEFVDANISGIYDDICYHVRAIESGDESDAAASNSVRIERFLLLHADVTRDGGDSGVLGPGDQHRFVFNREAAAETAEPNSSYHLSDGPRRHTVTCQTKGQDDDASTTDCSLNSTDVTVHATTYGPNRVLTVNIGTDDGLRTSTTRQGSSMESSYPVDMPNRGNNSWRDLGGNVVNIGLSHDNTLEAS